MAQIRIDTARVREVGQRFGREADCLAEIGHELQGAIHYLDTWAWDGRSRARAEPLLARVRPESARLAEGLSDLGRKLARVADEFDREDANAARNLEGMPWVEFASATEGTEVSSTQKGYVDNENIDSISEERLQDLKRILGDSQSGREVSEWLDEYGVRIEFGDAKGIAYCSLDGKKIVINKKYANLSDYELAAILMHEGQHSLDTHPFDIPMVGPILNEWYNIQDDFMYAAYPFPEEYRAFRAQAEFWLEMRDKAPYSSILEDVVDLIFTDDGGYRDIDAVYHDLHNNYGYEGVFNP